VRSILLLNGPNLNLLGSREPQHYGHETLAEVIAKLITKARAYDLDLRNFQSNHEGALIDSIHQAKTDGVAGVIINPGAYGHTSIALRDAFIATALPFIEVHISNIYARESFRHHSYLAGIAVGVITGLGSQGYELALQALAQQLNTATSPI
jgi:3-dehydroquinate dehydratase-2